MEDVIEQIRKDMAENPVIVYIKGTSQFPQCGFSALLVQILQTLDISFKAVDVLANPEIRQRIKEVSNWPMIPQLYIRGQFIGGCDLIREIHQTGELLTIFDKYDVPYNKELTQLCSGDTKEI